MCLESDQDRLGCSPGAADLEVNETELSLNGGETASDGAHK